MMSPELRKALYTHLQTAIEIELSTIPIYLYTYYSHTASAAGYR